MMFGKMYNHNQHLHIHNSMFHDTINIGSVSLHEQVYNHYNIMFMTFNVEKTVNA